MKRLVAERQGIYTIFIFCYSATTATVCETFLEYVTTFFFSVLNSL